MSDSKLDLSVPDTASGKNRKGGNGLLLLLVLAVGALAGVNTYLLVSKPLSAPETNPGSESFLTPQQEREYAARLEEKGLYEQAAHAWGIYLVSDECTDKAAILFRKGDCLYKAGKYGVALDCFYRAEQLDTENSLETSDRIQKTLRALGNYVAVEKDLSERTSPGTAAPQKKVLADVAGETITEGDLKKDIERQIDIQLAQIKGKVPMEQYNKQKADMMSRYLDNPRMMEAVLQSKVRNILLYRESLARKIKETPAEQSLLEQMRRELVGGRMLRDIVQDKIQISESDVQTWFRANKDDYAEKPSVKVRVLKAGDKAEADKLYEKVKSDKTAFFGLSDNEPLNKQLDTWVAKGQPFPGIGSHPDLLAFYTPEVKKGDIFPPVEINKAFYIFQVSDKHEGRDRSFDEVKEQAARDLYQQKYTDTEKAVLDSLMKKYNVNVDVSRFRKKDEQNTK